jgi:hypothetical protein
MWGKMQTSYNPTFWSELEQRLATGAVMLLQFHDLLARGFCGWHRLGSMLPFDRRWLTPVLVE